VHHRLALELQFPPTHAAQEWWTLILDVLLGKGITIGVSEREFTQWLYCNRDSFTISEGIHITSVLSYGNRIRQRSKSDAWT